MNTDDIQTLLRRLGCRRVRVKANGWVTSTCPFARWTHGGGVDASPSFGVGKKGAGFRYRCLGCGQGNLLSALPFALKARGHPDAEAVLEFLRTRNVASLGEIRERVAKADYVRPPKIRGTPGDPTAPVRPVTDLLGDPTVPILPETDLWHFMKLPEEVLALPTLAKRVITPRTYEDWQIRWHPGVGRIAIPTRDHKKRLVGIAGRLGNDAECHYCDKPFLQVEVAVEDFEDVLAHAPVKKKVRWVCPDCGRKRPPKYLHTTGFSRDNFLFGEHRIVPGAPGVMVEGQFDAIGLHQWGYNAVGAMGTWLSQTQIAKVIAWFPRLTVLHETDAAGLQMAELVRGALAAYLPLTLRPLPDGRDADELQRGEARDILGPPTLPGFVDKPPP